MSSARFLPSSEAVLAWQVLITSKQVVPEPIFDCHTGIPTNGGHLHWDLCPSLGEVFFHVIHSGTYPDAIFSQAAQAVSNSQDALVTVFERIENFFRRLETYVEVPPTAGMTDIIVKIMVEVLCILSIATKELKQSRASELIPGDVNCSYRLTGCLGKYVKKLIGRTDIEDALNRLDRLAQDEVGMAAAQGLNATHKVDDKVKGVDDRVRGVDDKIDLVIDGVQLALNQPAHVTQF